jgi:hypothetical protein
VSNAERRPGCSGYRHSGLDHVVASRRQPSRACGPIWGLKTRRRNPQYVDPHTTAGPGFTGGAFFSAVSIVATLHTDAIEAESQ